MDYIISYAGVVVLFTGLTAYDTQKIRNMSRSAFSYSVDEGQFVKLSVLGALILYLDFHQYVPVYPQAAGTSGLMKNECKRI